LVTENFILKIQLFFVGLPAGIFIKKAKND